MVKTTKPFVLLIHWRNPFITSAGTEKFIQLQVETFKKADIDSIIVFPVRKKVGITIFGWGVLVNRQFFGVYDEAKITKFLCEVMNKYPCKGIFVHHLMWSDLESLQRVLSFSSEIIFYIHDYYSCCEQQNLLKNDESYCGNGSIKTEKCHDCKYYKVALEKKAATKKFFDSFEKLTIIAPSEIAANIWIEGYPEYKENVRIIEHLTVSVTEGKNSRIEKEKLNIAFVGTGTKSKGWNMWIEAIEALPDEIRSQYNLYHMGFTPKEYSFIKHVPVSIAEGGPNAMVDALKKYDIDVAMLLSIWPETYCYTFYEALQAGCYVITTECSGNIQKQVQTYNNGKIVELDINSLKDLFENESKVYQIVDEHKKNNSVQYTISYSDDYLKLIKNIEIKSSSKTAKTHIVNKAIIADILYRVRYRKRLRYTRKCNKRGK